MSCARPSLILGLLLAWGVAAQAVEPKPTWPERDWNSHPADGDLVLPMPCGGAMTFRRVEVPSTGELDDYKITVARARRGARAKSRTRTRPMSVPPSPKPAAGPTIWASTR